MGLSGNIISFSVLVQFIFKSLFIFKNPSSYMPNIILPLLAIMNSKKFIFNVPRLLKEITVLSSLKYSLAA